MSGVRVESYREPSTFLQGLKSLRQTGLTPRGLLFCALTHEGAIHLGVPEDPERITSIKIGEKLALVWPKEGRYFHFDSVHRLPGSFVLWNGDRRLKDPGNHTDVAMLLAQFLKGFSAKNVLFGCTPHQPGAWISDGKATVALHDQGIMDVVPVAQGLLGRKVMDGGLYYLSFEHLASTGKFDSWSKVFDSPLGNVLVIERRVLLDRLVLSCEQGLVEVDVSRVPQVIERNRAPSNGSFAVVGRIDGGAFAVTTGSPQPWGLDSMRPALLVGGEGATLVDLGRALSGG
jgi:hypothetical protein